MAAPPLALVFSVIGLVKDRKKGYATAGLVVGGLTCGLWALAFVCL